MNLQQSIDNQIEKLKPALIGLLQSLVRIPSYPCTLEENKCLDLIRDFLPEKTIIHDEWTPDWGKVERVTAFGHGDPLYTHNETFSAIRDQIKVLVSTYGAGEKLIVLNGHVDVVGTEPAKDWTIGPFSGEVRAGRLFGRGAVDMKGGLVAHIGALKAIADLSIEINGRIQLQAVPEEEIGGNGTLACIERGYIGAGTVFAETTDEKIVHHHTGIQDFKVQIVGRPGFILWHNPGVDSVYALGKVLLGLEKLQNDREAAARIINPDFYENDSPGFINIGRVSAGEWDATCPTQADIQGLMALLPGESPLEAVASIASAVKAALQSEKFFVENPPKVSCKSIGHRGASLESGHPLVKAFYEGAQEMGMKDCVPTKGGLMVCDAKITQGGGFSPSIVFGPRGWSAHAADEYVEIDSVIRIARATAAGIIHFLNQ